ncbi:MAG: hypothetical protein AB7P52_15995 [Alphaproteobacteria bacterium]
MAAIPSPGTTGNDTIVPGDGGDTLYGDPYFTGVMITLTERSHELRSGASWWMHPSARKAKLCLMCDDVKTGAVEATEILSPLDRAKRALAPYLEMHPESAVEEIKQPDRPRLAITKPWGEEGLVIFLPDPLEPLADALNNVLLPESFTAMWHRDTRQLEVIWTAFPLKGPFADVAGRKFTFRFESCEHECQFGSSSARLLLIAEHTAPTGMSATQYRNLQSYHQYIDWQKQTAGKEDAPKWPGSPRSFWVHNFDWNAERALRFARHLNFYMTYYDSSSPDMLVWPPKSDDPKPRTRYIIGQFPSLIDARLVEDDLLHYWDASRKGDAARQFVYAYRIIEYASYTHIGHDARLKVRQLLNAPHAFSDTAALAERVIAAALGSETDDIRRIFMLLEDTVNPGLVWREIAENRAAFENETRFDGGCVMKPLISKTETESTFVTNGVSQFAQSARQIRNHLSHGRDQKTQTSITPTVSNFRKLKPWVSVLSVVAGEVINNRRSL